MSTYGQGGTREWRRVRQEVLDRDHGECQLRFSVCKGVATEVHHTIGLSALGGTRAEANHADLCVAACSACHAVITQRQARAGKMRGDRLRAARLKLPAHPHPGER